MQLLNFIQKRLLWLILLVIFLGLAFTKLTGGYDFTPSICLLAALVMIYPSLVPLEFDQLSQLKRHKIKILASLLINFIIIPALALILGWLFLRHEPGLWLGLILLSVLPGGGMATTWAFKSRADMPLTISIVFVNLAAAIIIAPIYLSLAINHFGSLSMSDVNQSCVIGSVTDNSINCTLGGAGINPLKIALPILIIIVIPLILAFATQKFLQKRYGLEDFNRLKQNFAAASNLGMLIVLLVLMGIKQNIIVFDHPELIFKAVWPLALFYFISFLIAWSVNNRFKGAQGKAMFWGTYLRYITLGLGLAISLIYQNPQYNLALIMIVLSYLIQIPSSFWAAKKLNH